MPRAVSDVTRVELVVRADCHLCDEARAVLRQVFPAGGWAERDVDADPDDALRWSEMVPVLLVDDDVRGYWRIEESVLRDDLARRDEEQVTGPGSGVRRRLRRVLRRG